jgi:hypothetical protein
MKKFIIIVHFIALLSCQPSNQKDSSNLISLAQPVDEEIISEFPDFLVPPFKRQGEIYIGKRKKDSVNEFVYGIEFKVIDSVTISYEVTSMINWQNPIKTSGLAKLDLKTLDIDSRTLTDRKGVQRPAYRFFEQQEDCTIDILVSKDSLINRTSAQAFRLCENQIDSLTAPLYHK